MQPGEPEYIGPYRLVRELGSGGMGRVFLARSSGGRPVAVKVIRPDLAADPEFRARFRHEVAASRKVNGLYTALVLDADVDGPVPWLATAYVAGPSLADKVRLQGPLPADAVVALAAGLAEGLGAIHAAGLVHRDLKPSNVLLADDGPRVIDFGISRAVESSTLTGTGLVVGSPGFMSPEQATGDEVGPLSDVFSLGAVLTFASTGRGPFGTGSAPALGYRVVHAEANLAGVPARIKPIIGRCLAKDPGERPGIAELLAKFSDLDMPEDWLPATSSGRPGTTPTPTLEARPGPAPGVTGDQLAPVARAEDADGEGDGPVPAPARAAMPEDQPDPAFERTESRITAPPQAPAVTAPSQRTRTLARLRNFAGTPRGGVILAVALAAVVGSSVLVALPGSSPPAVRSPGAGSSRRAASSTAATRSPDTKSSRTAVPLTPSPFASLRDPAGQAVKWLAFRPHGTTLAVGDTNHDIYLWDVATRKVTATLADPGGSGVNAAAFSPDGATLAVGDNNGTTYLWNAASGQVMFSLASGGYPVESVAFSPDGAMLAVSSEYGAVYLWDMATRSIIHALSPLAYTPGGWSVYNAAFSPDGKTLAAAIDDGHNDTFLWNIASGKPVGVLTDPGGIAANWVTFDPDGNTLAASDHDGSTYIWRLPAGEVTATLTDPAGYGVNSAAFSPNGKTLATADNNGTAYLWTMATGTLSAALTDPARHGVNSVSFSPQGATVATGDAAGRIYLWKLPSHDS